MFNKTADVIYTDSGQYGILLDNIVKKGEYINSQIYFCSYLNNKIQEHKKKVALKFHAQFPHASSGKLMGLLKTKRC